MRAYLYGIPGRAPKGSSSSKNPRLHHKGLMKRQPLLLHPADSCADSGPGVGEPHFVQHLCCLFAGSALMGTEQTHSTAKMAAP